MSYNRIQTGTGVYKCVDCGKYTRDTGNGEGFLDICAACYEIAELENMHIDEGHSGPLPECPECMHQASKKVVEHLPLTLEYIDVCMTLNEDGYTFTIEEEEDDTAW